MEEQQSAVQAAVRPGLIMGLISLALTYLIYFVDSAILVNGWFGLAFLVIFFALLIVFGNQYRSEIGGFMDFGTGFKFSFVAILISGVLSMLGQILLYQVVDPDLPEVLAKISLENQVQTMESFGASVTPEMMTELEKSVSGQFTLTGQLTAFGFALIFYAIISLIVAAIIKKKDKSLDY